MSFMAEQYDLINKSTKGVQSIALGIAQGKKDVRINISANGAKSIALGNALGVKWNKIK